MFEHVAVPALKRSQLDALGSLHAAQVGQSPVHARVGEQLGVTGERLPGSEASKPRRSVPR